MSFPIPSDSTQTNQKDGRMAQGWYTFLYNLWRPLRNLLKIEDGRVLFMDGNTVNGAIVGQGLTLDRTTNTLSAQAGSGFPEAPQDGRQYGRQMLDWTVIAPPVIPGGQDKSVQFNDGGRFGGGGDFLWDKNALLATINGSLLFDGAARRIFGDFSNAIESNRVLFQSSGTNATSNIGVIPSGTANFAEVEAYANSDPNNASSVAMVADKGGAGICYVETRKSGSGIDLPLQLRSGSGGTFVTGWPNGNVRVGFPTVDPGVKFQVDGESNFLSKGTFPACNSVSASIRLSQGTTAPSFAINGDMWITAAGIFAHYNGADVGPLLAAGGNFAGGIPGEVQVNIGGGLAGITNLLSDGTDVRGFTMSGAKANFAATATGYASIKLPHGTAPSAPVNGDLWTTTTGLYAQINGSTVGPFGSGGGAPTNASYVVIGTNVTLTDERVLTAGTGISIVDSGAGNAVTISVTGGAAYSELALSDRPTRYYRLNDTSGSTAVDSSSAASNGTYNNTPTLNQASMLYSGEGASVSFNGTDETMTFSGGLTGTLDSNALVIWDALVNISGTSLGGCMFSVQVDGKNLSFGVGNTTFANTGNNFIALQQGNAYFNSGVAIGTGDKYLAAAWSKAASQIYLFIDGVCVHVATTNTSSFSGVDCVGGLTSGLLFFAGRMQEASTIYRIVSNTVTGTPLQTASNIIYRKFQNFERAV
jgi:hypothetical protein